MCVCVCVCAYVTFLNNSLLGTQSLLCTPSSAPCHTRRKCWINAFLLRCTTVECFHFASCTCRVCQKQLLAFSVSLCLSVCLSVSFSLVLFSTPLLHSLHLTATANVISQAKSLCLIKDILLTHTYTLISLTCHPFPNSTFYHLVLTWLCE